MERFDEKVVILEDTCHIWTGALTDGYGRFTCRRCHYDRNIESNRRRRELL